MKLEIKKMSFPEQVRFVRMFLQLSQTELAEQIGISYATVSRWERENRTPQLAMLGKFYSFCMRNGIDFDIYGEGEIK
ncbi:MAG: helix-turn-helix transcriptional regulator [Clostridia bacterium]|nr:helix-turn-helix transcriptional regulator [Clostridia bacterium]